LPGTWTGYVGLVSGTFLASLGHDVTCVDVDRDKIEAINAGESPIHEAGLSDLQREVAGTRLHATTTWPPPFTPVSF
jgi:UDPglucose 6-dehydrogenase